MTTITNYVLRQQLQNIANSKSNRVSSTTTNTTTGSAATSSDTDNTVKIETKKFNKLTNYSEEIVFYDGTKAKILQPAPFVKWTSKKTDSAGNSTLDSEMEATILTVGNQRVVLGFSSTNCGLSHQLELLVDLGESEVIINDEYLSIRTKHLAENGVEKT